MPGVFNVPSGKALTLLGGDEAALITNTHASNTLYVSNSSSAPTSSSNDFSIAAAGKRVVNGPAWAIASADTLVLKEELLVPVRPRLQQRRWWTVNKTDISTETDTTPTANRGQVAQIEISARQTLTTLGYLIGSVGGTDKAIGVLYDLFGNVLAFSAKAGVTVGTANTYQELPFTTPVEILHPGVYHAAIVMNGTTARFRASTATGVVAGTMTAAADFSANPVATTVPTTSAAAPIIYVY